MISSHELRLGNYVLANGNLSKVYTITGTTVFTIDARAGNEEAASEHSLESISAVPLTNDVLEECGFVFHHYFKFWQLITTGIRSEMDIDTDYAVIDFMRKPIMKNLASLHQLQNIYFLLKARELVFTKKSVAEIIAD